MRWKLEPFVNQRIKVRGIFDKMGTAPKSDIRWALIQCVEGMDGKELTDHIHVQNAQSIEVLEPTAGELIEFDALVKFYWKFRDRRESFSEENKDVGLYDPTNVRLLERVVNQPMLQPTAGELVGFDALVGVVNQPIFGSDAPDVEEEETAVIDLDKLLTTAQVAERFDITAEGVRMSNRRGILRTAHEQDEPGRRGYVHRWYREEDCAKLWSRRPHYRFLDVQRAEPIKPEPVVVKPQVGYVAMICGAKRALELAGGLDRLRAVREVVQVVEACGGWDELLPVAEAL